MPHKQLPALSARPASPLAVSNSLRPIIVSRICLIPPLPSFSELCKFRNRP